MSCVGVVGGNRGKPFFDTYPDGGFSAPTFAPPPRGLTAGLVRPFPESGPELQRQRSGDFNIVERGFPWLGVAGEALRPLAAGLQHIGAGLWSFWQQAWSRPFIVERAIPRRGLPEKSSGLWHTTSGSHSLW